MEGVFVMLRYCVLVFLSICVFLLWHENGICCFAARVRPLSQTDPIEQDKSSEKLRN